MPGKERRQSKEDKKASPWIMFRGTIIAGKYDEIRTIGRNARGFVKLAYLNDVVLNTMRFKGKKLEYKPETFPDPIATAQLYGTYLRELYEAVYDYDEIDLPPLDVPMQKDSLFSSGVEARQVPVLAALQIHQYLRRRRALPPVDPDSPDYEQYIELNTEFAAVLMRECIRIFGQEEPTDEGQGN
jgi:hypothetical protein